MESKILGVITSLLSKLEGLFWLLWGSEGNRKLPLFETNSIHNRPKPPYDDGDENIGKQKITQVAHPRNLLVCKMRGGQSLLVRHRPPLFVQSLRHEPHK
jgi:hypothetical protein